MADILVVLNVVERFADLINIRKDDLGLALLAERQPRRGRSFAASLRSQKTRNETAQAEADIVDPDGVTF